MLRSLALLCCILAGSLAVADDHHLTRLRIVRDLAAGNERLGLRGGDAVGGHGDGTGQAVGPTD
jgi:hypothetical protein